MLDRDRGEKVFRAFYNNSRALFPSTFKYSFSDFLNFYGSKSEIYLDGVGGGVREAGISDSKIESAMRSLARASKGQIPKNPMQFFSYLSGEATKIDYVDAAFFVAKESVKDIAKGAQAVGDSLIFSGKILNFLLPGIVLFFVFFWINKKTEGSLSRALKK